MTDDEILWSAELVVTTYGTRWAAFEAYCRALEHGDAGAEEWQEEHRL